MALTQKVSEAGVALQSRMDAIYLPLIDMPPAEYNTILISVLPL